jgi:hypothetical protein
MLELEVPKAAVLRLHLHDVAVLGEDVLCIGTQTGVDLDTRSMVNSSILRCCDLVKVKHGAADGRAQSGGSRARIASRYGEPCAKQTVHK